LSEFDHWRLAFIAALLWLLLLAVDSACKAKELPAEVHSVLEDIRSDNIIAHACQLCDPRYAGREAGTGGVKKSADYIVRQFRDIGLRPGGSVGSFFQQFKIMPGYRISSELKITLGRIPLGEFKRGRDYMPTHIPNKEAQIKADCALVGYGLTIPDKKFDEYGEIDVRDKAVIVFSGVPSTAPSNTWKTDLKYPDTLSNKAKNAAAHGAVCLLVVDNPIGWRKALAIPQQLRLPEMEFPLNSPIPILHVTREFVATITGMTMNELRLLALDIVREQTPSSMLLRARRLSFRASVSGTAMLGRNIIGILPGRDETLRQEAVVIGAHYDHLGTDGNDVYFGANDNAAGVGALLEVARSFVQMNQRPRRSLIFIGFDAEEIGKRGSKYYVSHPCIPMERTVLMINFDMIGRNDFNEIKVVGTRSSRELHEIHQRLNEYVGLLLTHPQSFRLGRSDHTAFYDAGVPIMYLFGGLDPDYNTPGDTPDKLIPHKVERVAKLAFLTAQAIAERPERIQFDRSANPSGFWLD
jgi:hypothetical protein